MEKYCKFCKTNKDASMFAKSKHCSFGLSNKCKFCTKKYRSTYNKDNKIKILEYNLNFNKTYNPKWAKNNNHIVKWRGILYRNLLYKGVKKNGKTEKILGYNIKEFKKHIEEQFNEIMNWNNIDIDHKIPLTWFKKCTPIYIVNSFENIQPLTSFDNTSKRNRYCHPISKTYYDLIKNYVKLKYLKEIKFL